MPKKKKTASVSPSRKILDSEKVVSFAGIDMAPPPGTVDTSELSSNKEKLLRNLSEMFSDLDPDVVYMVLSESDFKVNVAMDYLLELSTAAKGAVASSPSDSGFDFIAASLDDIGQESSIGSTIADGKTSAEENLSPSDKLLTAELDSLIDNAFETYGLNNCYYPCCGPPDSILQFKALDPTHEICEPPDLVQPSLNCDSLLPVVQNQAASSMLVDSPSIVNAEQYASSYSDQISTAMQTRASTLVDTGLSSEGLDRSSAVVLASDHGTTLGFGIPRDMGGVSGNSDAALYSISDHRGLLCQPWQEIPNRSSKDVEICKDPDLQSLKQEVDLQKNMEPNSKLPVHTDTCRSQPEHLAKISAVPCITWNPLACEFYPRDGCYSFVTPIAASPVQWKPLFGRVFRQGVPASSAASLSPWHNSGSFAPNLWGQPDGKQRKQFYPAAPLPVIPNVKRKTQFSGKVLVLLRGVPGSGKSTLARTLLEENPSGIILSSDDYFSTNGRYQYDVRCLGEAHEWTQLRAKEAFEKMVSPIIIDNTNTRAWEMKPYVAMAVKCRYGVVFREPDTWWKFKPKELERRNTHGVTKEKIKIMLERYDRCFTVKTILNSSAPDQLKHDFNQPLEHEGDGGNIFAEETHMKEEELLTSSLTHHPAAKEGNLIPVMSPSSPLQNFLDCSISDSEEEKKEMETGIVEANSENSCVLSTIDSKEGVYSTNKLVYLECDEVREEITGSEGIETGSKEDTVTSGNIEILSMSSIGGVEEIHDTRPRESHTECNQCSEVPTESETVDENKFSTLAATLNFVGDWPVEQSIGQRIKRTHTFSSAQSCNEIKSTSFHPLESITMASDNFKVGLDDDLRNVLDGNAEGHSERQEGSSFDILESAKVEVELVNTLSDWPFETLDQRPQRSRRASKNNLNEVKVKAGINEHVDICDLQNIDMLQGTSGTHGEMQDNITSTCHDASALTSETREMKYKQNRRACKLALTFMNSSLSSVVAEPPFTINVPESSPELYSCKGANQYSQTEPQEFAFVWRLEKRKSSLTESAKVLSGRADRFKPKDLEFSLDFDSQGKISYRVMHDKSTSVEESELVSVDEMENLKILCKLFRSVSFDVLEDLYERCHKDIVWATNLLLDSGEKLFKEDEDDCYEGESKDVNIDPVGSEVESKVNSNPEKDFRSWQQIRQREEPGDFIQHFENVAPSFCELENKTICAKLESAESLELNTSVQESEFGNDILHNVDAGHLGLDCTKQDLSLVIQPNALSDLSADYVIQSINQPPATMSDMQSLDDASPSHGFNMSSRFCLEEEGTSEVEAVGGPNVDNKLTPVLETNPVTESGNSEEIYGFEENEHTLGLLPIGVERSEEETRTKILSTKPVPPESLNFDCLELSLPPELASQLSELFGPVGIDPGSLTAEDCVVYMDLNLAQAIHKKWKESIMERQKQEALSYQLILKDWSLSEQLQLDSAEIFSSLRRTDSELLSKKANWTSQAPAPLPSGPCKVFSQQQELTEVLPFMDYWNTQTPQVSLRQIMSEEIAFQEHQDLRRFPISLKKDCATKLKEKQLKEMYPNLDQKLLMDIFRDSGYLLEKTQQLLKFVLQADPVQNVVAQEIAHQSELSPSCNAEKTREKSQKMKAEEDFQDIETPDYDDFRAEAFLHRNRQQECFRKAAEAYRRGMKSVATFYAQQGHLHGQKLKEANARAAEQIFERLNEPLLQENVLDLHGLHVEEALKRLRCVLKEKTEEYKQSAVKPYLSVITGRGNHSQGGVARIRPAVTDYLANHSFRFTEPKPGVLQVTLK